MTSCCKIYDNKSPSGITVALYCSLTLFGLGGGGQNDPPEAAKCLEIDLTDLHQTI